MEGLGEYNVFMKKVVKYIQTNWKPMVAAIYCGFFFSFVFILYIPKSWIKAVATFEPSSHLYLLLGIYSVFLLLIYKPALAFWRRYRNNFRLQEIPCTYMEPLFLFFASLIITILIFQSKFLRDISFSQGMRTWLIISGAFSLLWFFLIIYHGWTDKASFLKYKEPSSGDFFPDEPIKHEDDDRLDRKPFVNNLYNQIVKYPVSDSFVFGLYGTWGEGKTSVLNLLKNKLSQNKDIILFEYDPWHFSSQDAVIKGFYEGLYASLNKDCFLPNIKRMFIKYQQILSWGLKVTGIDLNIGLTDDSFEKLKKGIQYSISLTGKKIIILIDDIDRLPDKNEIFQIFKIVKLSGNFKNTIYVLSLDPGKISSQLEDDISKAPSFLDKIIQNPVDLPVINQTIIDKFLFYSYPDQDHLSAIDRLFQTLEIDKERLKAFDKDFVDLYNSQIKKLFPTLRHAKRYLNCLYATLPAVKNEINLHDFLILELIRIFYHEVYEDIWANPWCYIPSSWDLTTYISSPLSITLDNKQKHDKVRQHVGHIIDRQNNRELVLELLKTIFFVELKNALEEREVDYDAVAHEYRAEKRITHPDVFPKYFMLKVPSDELPDEIIESLISVWEKLELADLELRLEEDFKKFKQESKLLELLEKLVIFRPKLRAPIAESLIRLLFKNINTFSKKGRENLWHSEFDRAESLMIRLINEKVDKAKIEPLLLEIVKDTPSFELAVHILLACRRERGGSCFNIYENVRIDYLHKELSERLTNYFIEGKKDIFEEEEAYSFILYQWGALNQEERQKVNDYVFSLIANNPKYLVKIILPFTTDWGEPVGKELRYDDLIRHYDEETLYKKIKEHYLNTYSNQDEKLALDVFIRFYEERQKTALKGSGQEAK